MIDSPLVPRPVRSVAAVLLILLTTLFSLAPTAPAKTDPTTARKASILYLSSYHPGYKWSDDILRGIQDQLRPLKSAEAFHIEYMDMKRYPSPTRFSALFASLREKYRNIDIDYVISADDFAFLFLERYQPQLFPGATVVFCGTNYLDRGRLQGLDNFYGINEEIDLEANFRLIFRLHPKVKSIYVINDDTLTGRLIAPRLEHAIEEFDDRARFIRLEGLTMTEMLAAVSSLPQDAVIFYVFYFRDAAGRTFEYDESASLITGAAPVPVYATWDFFLGYGVVGGMLTSGYHQGQAAGRLALRMIGEGIMPQNRLQASPNRYMFDYRVLRKYGISVDALPPDSTVLNRPESFYVKHRQVLLFSLAAIAALLVVIVVLVSNISLRRKVELRLQQSERNFREIFENAVEGLFQAGPEGRFLRVNPALARILRCDSVEDTLASYRNLEEDLFVNPEERRRLARQLRRGGHCQEELEVRCRDGAVITVLLHCHNVVDDRGRHLYVEGSMTDMTEYKMTQEIIIQTEKMLSLGGLSAGIAHEIKNPLTSMIQAAQIIAARLARGSDPNEQAAEKAEISLARLEHYLNLRDIPALLANITDSGKRANIIVEDMLSFSRKSIGEFADEELPAIVEEAVELARKDYSLSGQYAFKRIALTLDYQEGLPPLYCSRSKIIQVLFNILKNSAEAMQEAQSENPALAIAITYDADTIRLVLADNGPGMEERVREKIFEPFYTTKGGKKGTGLGMSVAYFIVCENHKGAMSVTSSPGQGAAFTLEFPRDMDSAGGAAAEPAGKPMPPSDS